MNLETTNNQLKKARLLNFQPTKFLNIQPTFVLLSTMFREDKENSVPSPIRETLAAMLNHNCANFIRII